MEMAPDESLHITLPCFKLSLQRSRQSRGVHSMRCALKEKIPRKPLMFNSFQKRRQDHKSCTVSCFGNVQQIIGRGVSITAWSQTRAKQSRARTFCIISPLRPSFVSTSCAKLILKTRKWLIKLLLRLSTLYFAHRINYIPCLRRSLIGMSNRSSWWPAKRAVEKRFGLAIMIDSGILATQGPEILAGKSSGIPPGEAPHNTVYNSLRSEATGNSIGKNL